MYFELQEIKHRPYPMPNAPWIMTQVWRDLLFMHYPVAPHLLREIVPQELELDTYKNEAWLSIIPLKITDMRVRGVPPIPLLSSYIELNVRTYVIYQGVPGIYFFSLDASDLISVIGAKAGTGLPYKLAKMEFSEHDDIFRFKSHRITGTQEKLDVSFKRGNVLYEPLPGSLDFWLLERYCMYSFWGNHILRGDIHHDQWKVAHAEAEIHQNTMASFLPKGTLTNNPLILHYARRRRFLFFPLKKVGKRVGVGD